MTESKAGRKTPRKLAKQPSDAGPEAPQAVGLGAAERLARLPGLALPPGKVAPKARSAAPEADGRQAAAKPSASPSASRRGPSAPPSAVLERLGADRKGLVLELSASVPFRMQPADSPPKMTVLLLGAVAAADARRVLSPTKEILLLSATNEPGDPPVVRVEAELRSGLESYRVQQEKGRLRVLLEYK